MNIPFLDLITPHRELEEELVGVFRESLRTASFVGGSQVQAFEEEFGKFCETEYCVAVKRRSSAGGRRGRWARFDIVAVLKKV